VKLINFGYLHRQRVLTLIAILSLVSALFSVTAYSFLGFYNGFTSYVGSENDVLAIYGATGATPLTGAVALALTDKVAAVNGVLAASPETIAPATLNGQSVFVRGVLPQSLNEINSVTILQGEALDLNDTGSAVVGETLSQRLNLKVGDQILVFGALSDCYVQLSVKGIFVSQSPLDDEVLVPLYVSQWLRGFNYNVVTLIRAEIDPNIINSHQLYQTLANQTVQPTSIPSPTPKSETQRALEFLVPLAQTNITIGNVKIEDSQLFMKSYLDRYGVSKDTLIILSVVVLVLASGTALCAFKLFLKQHTSDLETLRSIGVSSKQLKFDLAVRIALWSLIATVIGTALSVVALLGFKALGLLQVLSHTVTFQLEPLIVLANFVFLFLLLSWSVSRREFKL
jgi:ABC-type lipoprotein release transport system permease subunit